MSHEERENPKANFIVLCLFPPLVKDFRQCSLQRKQRLEISLNKRTLWNLTMEYL